MVVGVARLSPNWLVQRIVGGYVELMRNTPLLVQLFILYFAVFLQLPAVAQSITLPGSVSINQRGVFMPAPQLAAGFLAWFAFLAVGVVGLVVARRISRRREDAGHAIHGLRIAGWAWLVAMAVIGWIVTSPINWDVPVQGNFNFTGGLSLTPEFTALLVAWSCTRLPSSARWCAAPSRRCRTASVEAARALGLSEGARCAAWSCPRRCGSSCRR